MDRKRQAQEDNLPNGLSAPAQRALAGAGYTSLEQLSRATEEDIKNSTALVPMLWVSFAALWQIRASHLPLQSKPKSGKEDVPEYQATV
jgi:hypothetical protein